MAEITIDGDLVIGASVDGEDVAEVTIDGCSITFEELYRSGYFAITGGSGSRNIPLPDSNYIMQAGIRFRGRAAVNTTLTTDTGYVGLCITSGSGACGGNVTALALTSTPPYACSYSSLNGVRGYTRGQLHTQNSPTPTVSVWVDNYGPQSGPPPQTITGLYKSGGSSVYCSGKSDVSWNGLYDRMAISGRCLGYYTRTCYSADTTMALPGGSVKYPFILSSGSRSPHSSGGGVVTPDDGTGDLFWDIPLPWNLFTAGGTTTLQFTKVEGSGNVDIEVFVIYR